MSITLKPKSITEYQQGMTVYANVKGSGWVESTVATVYTNGKIDVTVKATGEKARNLTAETHVHIFHKDTYDAKDPDLFRIDDIHVAPLLQCLKERFEGEQRAQYHRMGDMILSVNPFTPMVYNSLEEREKYLKVANDSVGRLTSELAPHVWHIADNAYRQAITHKQGNQSIVISGESGSGKTENTKMMLGYLGALSQQNSVNPIQRDIVDRVNERVASSNPILESFGNARTVRNDNSSRFGKYIKLLFDQQSGVMLGAEMVTYLLERSRIVGCGKGERCYHVFYEMLAGLPYNDKKALGLGDAPDYPSLMQGNTLWRRGVDGNVLDDAKEFECLVKAMETMGIHAKERMAIWSVLACVLKLLHVPFRSDANGKAQLVDETSFAAAAKLIGVDPELLKPCFLVRSKSKILTNLSTKTEAEALRDSFCKALYVGVFDKIVSIVNQALAPATALDKKTTPYIGVLDIFGFENFTVNSFEQLCINYANETLANHYNRFVFTNDEAECKAEGIPMPNVEFPDNTETLHMFDAKGTGVFEMLDEECYFKGGTAAKFTEKLWERHASNTQNFMAPKHRDPKEFGVHHYACDTWYNTEGWLAKNSDPLKEEAVKCVQNSKYDSVFVRTLLDNADSVPGDGIYRKRTSVSSFFRTQLIQLRKELESTQSNFIRCIKPNMSASPAIIENEYVTSQLESCLVLQTIALKRQGYPVRRTHEAFARFFHSLGRHSEMKQKLKARDYAGASNSILELYGRVCSWKAPHYGIGRKKVFLRDTVWSDLERILLSRNYYRLRLCTPFLKQWVLRFRLRKKSGAESKHQVQLRKLEREQGGTLPKIGEDKMNWFREMCQLFPTMDAGVTFDVCGHATSKQIALRNMCMLRAQELDKHLPIAFHTLVDKTKLRKSVVKNMVQDNVSTIEQLHNVTEKDLDRYGLDADEKRRLRTAIVQQESATLHNQRLIASGTGLLDMSESQISRAVNAKGTRKEEEKVSQLVSVLGCTPSKAVSALRVAQGNESAAASLMVDGDRRLDPHNPSAWRPPARIGTLRRGSSLPDEWNPRVKSMIGLGVAPWLAEHALLTHNGDVRKALADVFGEE